MWWEITTTWEWKWKNGNAKGNEQSHHRPCRILGEFPGSVDVFQRNKWGPVKSRLAKREQKLLAFSVVSSRLWKNYAGVDLKTLSEYVTKQITRPGKTENARNNGPGREKIRTGRPSKVFWLVADFENTKIACELSWIRNILTGIWSILNRDIVWCW